MTEARPILCVDIGGTGIKAASLLADGSSFVRLPAIPTPGSLPELVEHLASLVASVPVCGGLALSAPGSIDVDALEVHGSSAVAYIHDNDWANRVAARTGLAVTMENDANCAGLAEVWFGAPDTPRSICTIVVGTGVGGAIVIDGRVHRGATMHGGEFGYMAVSLSGDGGLSHASRTASTSALVDMVTAQAGGSWDGQRVFAAADRGDPTCVAAVQRWYRNLAVVVHNVQYSIDPEAILLGGGVSQRPAFLSELGRGLDWVYEQLPVARVRPRVARCHFQADANLYGALAHFLNQRGELV